MVFEICPKSFSNSLVADDPNSRRQPTGSVDEWTNSTHERRLNHKHYQLTLQDQDDNAEMTIWKELVVINIEVLSMHLTR